MTAKASREVRTAFTLNVINGGLFLLSNTLMDTNLVLVWFLSNLTNSNLLLGLLGPIATGGWFLPQLYMSAKIQHLPRKIGVYRAVMIVRTIPWAILVATMWWVQDPVLLLIVFYIAYTVMRVAAGIGGIPYLEITAKTVPPALRGRLFAMRMLAGGLLGLLGSRFVKYILGGNLPYPHNYAVLVGVALVCGISAQGVLSFVREPPGETQPATSTLVQLKRGLAILRRDANYRHLLLGRSALFLGFIALPFYTVMARRILHAPDQAAGDFLMFVTATQLLTNYPWGWLADYRGRLWVSKLAAWGWLSTAVLALALLFIAPHLPPLPFPTYMLAYPLFVMIGIFVPADGVAGINLLLEIAPERERPLYVGFANTLLGLVTLLSGLGGSLVDWFGLATLFVATVIVNALALFFYARIDAHSLVQ